MPYIHQAPPTQTVRASGRPAIIRVAPAGDCSRRCDPSTRERILAARSAPQLRLVADRGHVKSGKSLAREDPMNKMLQMLVVGTIVTLGSGAVAVAAESMVGTWTLNLEKSKYVPGPAPKSQTRTYAQTADGTALTFSGVAADGSPVSGQSTFKYDGKDYPITGSPDYDTLTLKRINGSTVKSLQKKDGKVVGSTIRKISAHGKVLTLDSKGKSANGKSYHNVAVFDKQ
jgi:hypothetical protein